MVDPDQSTDPLAEWLALPAAIEAELEGISEVNLDIRGGAEGLSIRETAHHIVEANLVAASIIIAALGKSGCVYDWSWLYPDAAWTERMGYRTIPVAPAILALRATCQYISAVVRATPDGLERLVYLVDAKGAEPRKTTVEEIVRQEVAHASHHLADLREMRNALAG